ncbi:MAG: MBG domain-containing protein [Clostridia bacterium]|nr:MBG domain-containing protein [Clostridia bacterium]
MKISFNLTKRLLILFFALLIAAAVALTFTACDQGNGSSGSETEESGGQDTPTLKQFAGITFANVSFVYDGSEKTVTITGNLPQGASVEYENNKATNAGNYNAKATLTCEGYQTKALNATLVINKAEFGEIEFEGANVLHDGQVHSLSVDESALPVGTTVSYINNDKTDTGEYEVTATISNPNYVTKTLKATLKIYSLADVAKNLVSSVLNRPEPWDFLPEALSLENMAYSSLPVGGMEGSNSFASFVNVNNIGKRPIGKQMNVVYDVLGYTDTALSGANVVFTAGDAIASVYQNFINTHPEDYKSFTGSVTIAGSTFKLKIETQQDTVSLFIGNGTVNAELSTDGTNDYCRIQLTNGIALKYQSTDQSLKLAVEYTVSGKGVLQQLEFIRNDNAVLGYLYEYFGTENTGIKTSAVIYSNSVYTAIVSNKRETEDLLIHAYEEIYNSQTGAMIGGEVTENVSKIDYDTLWINLYDVSGIISVKVEDATNGTNLDTIYINGNSSPIKTKLVGIAHPTRATSRRFDIEMKDVWYVVATTDANGKISYQKTKTSIPLLFVQSDYVDSFNTDFKSENNVSATILTSVNVITGNFTTLSELFAEVKDLVDYDAIVTFIGSKSSFFEN